MSDRKIISKGGRNIIIMGAISIVIATATTGISLAIYHNSGDIYLDRSRPGFLPDEEEIEEEEVEDEDYNFDKNGPLTIEQIEEYIKMLKFEVNMVDGEKEPFSAGALSDVTLGIPAAEEK